MYLFYITIFVVASASALPRRYSERNNYGLEVASLNEPLVAASEPKNLAGKTEESGYHKTFGSDADGEKGFESGKFSHGQNGYKELDTFHKQVGDKYGFEENSEFGYEQEAENGQSDAQKKKDDVDGAGTSFESYYAGSGEYSGGGDTYLVGGNGDNYNQEYSTGNSGEGTYSSYSQNSNDGDTASSSEYDY